MDWRSRALERVDEDLSQLVDLLVRLVRIPSVTGSDAEHEAQAVVAAELRTAGFDVDHWPIDVEGLVRLRDFPGMESPRSEAWGVVGRLPGTDGGDGTARSLLLNGHIDVVPVGNPADWSRSPFSGAVEDGFVHGRGSCDMKAGLVAALVAARAVQRSGTPLQRNLLVASVAGEEDGGLGSYATLRRGWTADACVIPEPTSLAVVPACAGALTLRLTVPGRSAHASRRTEGVSAVEKFGPVLAALRALERRRNESVDPLMARWPLAYPIEIGTVRAGDWPSSVPDQLVAEGRLGVALGEPVEAARAELEAAVADACAADPWLSAHPVLVEWWGGQFAAGFLPHDSDLLESVRLAHRTVTGRSSEIWGAPYGSDLRLHAAAGIPTVHYGPGDVGLAHAPDERVPVEEVRTAARALAVLAVDLCGPATR